MTRAFPLIAALAALAVAAPSALATHAQPPLDNNKLDYSPIGHFKPGGPVPPDYGTACDTDMKPLLQGKIFNPSGKWNAFDTNVFETICLPFRNQDDESVDDPMGNGGGESRHGYCAGADPTDPLAQAGPAGAGTCPNHQLEFIDYFQTTMGEVLKDFGVTFQTYEFEHPEGTGRNPAAIIPGSDHADEHILIGSHYDQTTTGPASTWDSQEGHAEMIRIAKMMSDYWRATGTRPSATIKFVPMDGEEDGLLGSADYVANTIVPDQEAKVRGYWNADPCAGGYPAFHYGNRANRIDMGIQIGDSEDPRVTAFNEKVPVWVEQVFDRVDDTLETYPEKPELFVSTAEGLPGIGGDIGREVFIGKDSPVLFSSDWANFIAVNIPFFNPGPEVTGPNAPGSDGAIGGNQIGTPEGLYQFHTPLDNLPQMMRYTGGDPTGMTWSEGWMKGMEFCSHMLSWGMLQHDQAGAQTVNDDVVAYFEALPNEAERGRFVNFDGGGSYQYSDPAARTLVPESQLQWKWDFADGSRTAYGKEVRHAYRRSGTYEAKLTVTNRSTKKASTMTVPIVVGEGAGTDVDPESQFVDNLPPQDTPSACASSSAFSTVKVSPSGKGLKFDLARSGNQQIAVDVYRVSKGRKAAKPAKVRSFKVNGTFTWNGKPSKGRLSRGTYYVRVAVVGPNNRLDARAFAFEYTSRFKSRKAFQRADNCELISSFRLASPTFGGSRPLQVGFATTQAARVTITVHRGSSSKALVRATRTVRDANRFQRVNLSTKRLKRGEYRVKITARAGSARRTETLHARKY